MIPVCTSFLSWSPFNCRYLFSMSSKIAFANVLAKRTVSSVTLPPQFIDSQNLTSSFFVILYPPSASLQTEQSSEGIRPSVTQKNERPCQLLQRICLL